MSTEIRIVTREQHFKIIIQHRVALFSFTSTTMIILFSLFYFVFSQAIPTVHSDCPFVDLCICNKSQNQITCSGTADDDYRLPPMNNLPAVTDYYFSNFKIQPNAFENLTFLHNGSITIHLLNITTIYSDAFSAKMNISDDVQLSVSIIQGNDGSDLTLEDHAFDGINLYHLHFKNIQSFNGQGIFPSHAFGDDLYIDELIFEHTNLTGFDSIETLGQPDIGHLYIRHCPLFIDLSENILPAFLQATKTLEISGTGLERIDHEPFEAWKYTFKELLIKNNVNLKYLPDIVMGPFQSLEILDFSNNSITNLDSNYDWSSYAKTKTLLLAHQPRLDLFIKSDILKSMQRIRTIDFSQSIIGDTDENLIQDHVPNMPNLASINVSFTNFTDDMIIDLLTIISNSANQTIQVSLLDHRLNASNFCSFFQIFQNAPNLLRLELDETHPCNCITDLFYDDEHQQLFENDTLSEPSCIFNTSRGRCDIQSQLIISKCSFGNMKPDNGDDFGDIGTIGFIATMAGLLVVVVALLALGSRVVYRARRVRGMTILDMDDPGDGIVRTPTMSRSIENSLRRTTTMDDPRNASTRVPTISRSIENSLHATNAIEEPLHESFS